MKYIHKYVFKGHDRVVMAVNGPEQARNEIKEYLDGRWVGAPEALWRIFHHRMHQEWPAVERLPFHLPDQQMVTFNAEDSLDNVLQQAARETKLLAFFRRNQEDPHARQWLYSEFPQHFTWNQRDHIWKARQKGMAIGRLLFASPTSGARYHLRLLLTVVRGMLAYFALQFFLMLQSRTQVF